MKIHLILILLLGIVSHYSEAARILFFFGVSGKSHRFSAWPLVEALASRGHHVTFLSPYPPNNPTNHPNITDLVPKGLAEDLGLIGTDFVSIRLNGGIEAVDALWEQYFQAGIRGCHSIMQNEDVLEWVGSTKPYDVVIVDALFNECGYAFVHKFKAKFAMYSPTTHFSYYKEAFGYPDENWPEMEFHYTTNMTFLQSLRNILAPLYWDWRKRTEMYPMFEGMQRKVLNLTYLPPLAEIEKNASIMFTNTHFSEEFPRSLPPNFVDIGGLHCSSKTKPVSKEIEDFINKGTKGFVLLSFGTYAQISALPKKKQEIFFNVMRSIPEIQFIVKYNEDGPPVGVVLPKNVMLQKWLGQQDVIAHPKCLLFIGHGGLLSTQESVFHGVPMIVFPILAEQDFNAVRAHHRETAIAMEISDVNEEELRSAILQILDNPKYKTNILRVSKQFRDRPLTPLDNAVWWMEYMLRHDEESLSKMRPHGIHKSWFERRMLHIWGFLGVVLAGGIGITVLGMWIIISVSLRNNGDGGSRKARKNKRE